MTKKTRIITTITSFALVALIALLAVTNILSADIGNPCADYPFVPISYRYEYDGTLRTYEFEYNDGLFLCDSTQLNGDIAKMSIALSAAAYKQEQINNVLVDSMGFEVVNSQTFTYEYVDSMTLGFYEDLDRVAYSIARKSIGDYIVYCVPIKGTSANAEWYSNFNLGTGRDHEGFYHAADIVFTELRGFIGSDGYDDSHTIVLTTGHSRGAAVSNIIGGRLNNETSIATNHIFSYNFATPNVSMDADESMSNIFNFNNPGDFVTLLPLDSSLDSWGYKRNGTTIDSFYDPMYENNVYYQFGKNIGTCMSEHTPDNYLNLLRSIYPTKEDYLKPENQFLLRLISYCALAQGYTRGGELSAVFTYDGGVGAANAGLYIAGNCSIATGSISNIRSFLGDTLNSRNEQFLDLIEFIDDNYERLSAMTETEFDSFLNSHSSTISQIQQIVGIEIKNIENLSYSRYLLNDAISKANAFATGATGLVNLMCDSSGNLTKAIGDGHTADFYIMWMNTMFMGPKGWMGNTSDISFENVYNAPIYSIGKNCFNGCTNLTNVALPDTVTEIGSYAFSGCSSLTGTITIPSDVTEIQEYTFYGCSGITKLEIHEGVTAIGRQAFGDCGGIVDLTIPCDTMYEYDSFQYCYSIDHVLITGEGEMINYENASPLYSYRGNNYHYTPWYIGKASEVEISEGITSIGDYAFCEENNLYHITIPSTITKIGNYAFYECYKLNNELYLPTNVKEIGSYSFYGCSRMIGSITIPAGVTGIGSYAFWGCEGLTGELVIPSAITQIESGAFGGCSGIRKIVIHEGVTGIGERAFSGCRGIVDLTISCNTTYGYNTFFDCTSIDHVLITGEGEMMDYTYRDFASNSYKQYVYTPWYIGQSSEVVISEGITSIGDYAFYEENNLNHIALPSTITKIGKYAFYDCRNLSLSTESAILPGLTEIGTYAFYGCEGLTGELVIPEAITAIEPFSFAGCSGITKLDIHEDVTAIGTRAFSGCRGIVDLTIPCDTIYEYNTFDSCTSIDHVLITGEGEMMDYTYSQGSSYRNTDYDFTPWYIGRASWIDIAEGITSIGDYAFYAPSTPYLERITLPSSITRIGEYAFYNCRNLPLFAETTILPGLTEIGTYAFYQCSGLTGSISIPDSVNEIGSYAFYGCSGLTGTVTIPSGITDIKDYTFYSCSGIDSLEIHDGVESIGNRAFSGCRGIVDLTIPCDTMYEYNSFDSCTSIDHVTIIGQGDMLDYTYDTYDETPWYIGRASEVEISEGITSIGNYAFYSDSTSYLNDIILPSTITKIGSFAFYNCGNLPLPTETTILPGLTQIGRYAFYGCKGLIGELIIPEAITEIEPYTFAGCSGITKLDIHEGVTGIGERAFSGCGGIASSSYSGTRCQWEEIPVGYGNDPLLAVLSIEYDHNEVIDEEVPATCTEDGLTEGSHCSLCDEVIIEQEVIPATGHTEVTDDAVPATCTETGLSEGSHCSECGEIIVAQEEVPATGHTEVVDAAVDPTCTETGLTEGSHCSVCGEVIVAQEEVPAAGHTEVIDPAVESTETETGLTEGSHCSVCGEIIVAQEVIPAIGGSDPVDPGDDPVNPGDDPVNPGDDPVNPGDDPVNPGDDPVNPGDDPVNPGDDPVNPGDDPVNPGDDPVNPGDDPVNPGDDPVNPGDDPVNPGDDPVNPGDDPIHEHSIVVDPAVSATCTENGLTEGSHCSVCGEIIVAQEEVPATGHTETVDAAVDPTCTGTGLTEGSHCSVCGEVIVAQEEIPATGHTEVIDPAVEPTETETGLTEGSHCSVCGEVIVAQEVIPATGGTDPVEPTFVPGWNTIDGITYYINEDGTNYYGWLTLSGRKYYLDPETGAMQIGWQEIEGSWYYFKTNGSMVTGWKTLSGKTYYFDADGVMLTGWQEIEGSWYYFKTSGAMITGWKTWGSKTYYFDANGVMLTGWQDIEGNRYYFKTNGTMIRGWKTWGSKTYYFGDDGVMRTGWQDIDGNRYYFKTSGVMVKGWKVLSGKTYYFDPTTGAMATGLQTIDGKIYYFKTNGIMLTNTSRTINGIVYDFGPDGACTNR